MTPSFPHPNSTMALRERLRLIREAQDAGRSMSAALARERLEVMLELRDRGETLEAIGRHAGVSKQQVQRLLVEES